MEVLTQEHTALEQEYRAGYDEDDVREKALALGMIPVEEAETVQIRVSVPARQKDPTWWEDLVWFIDGLIE